MIRFASVFATLLLEASSVFAASPPKLDVQASCRRAPPSLANEQNTPYKNCIDSEMQAQKELLKDWSTFNSASQARCGEVVQLAGLASYVELLVCLELDKEQEEAAASNKKKQALPPQPPPSDAVAGPGEESRGAIMGPR
jgi:hypothetical protein